MLILLLVISFATTPLIVHADYGLAPNPNPVGSTITIDTNNAYSYVYFDNYGYIIITNNGRLSTDDTLNNNIGGNIESDGWMSINGTINNFWWLVNNGTLMNADTLNNSGMLYNTGWVGNSGTLNNSSALYNYGTIESGRGEINNSGTIYNYGNMYIDNSDHLTNPGTLNNYGTLTSAKSVENSGTINNNIGGTINYEEVFYNSNTLNNNGTMDINHNMYNFGKLTNNGTLNNGTLNNINSILQNDGTLNNYGTLNNNDRLDNYDTLNNYGTLNINYGTLIYNSGTINNYGTLNNDHGIDGPGNYIQTAGQTINNGGMGQSSSTFNGGILSGNGYINYHVTIGSGASVQPGNSSGTLTINGTFDSSGNFVFEIGGLLTGYYDVLDINGNANFTGGNIEFDFINGFNASAGNSWDFFFANSITGWNTLSFNLAGLGAGLDWEIVSLYDANGIINGKELLITQTGGGTNVPEPSTIILLIAGLAGLAAFRRKLI